MRIHLLRHGIAVRRDDPRCPPDPQRPLTDKGVSRTRAAAKGMRRLGIEPDLILTSPYLRARQTADIVQDVVAPGVKIKQLSVLVPDGDPAKMVEKIAATRARQPMCVGHAPSLDELAGYLLGCGGSVIELKKAGLVSLEGRSLGPGELSLHAALPPSMLRSLDG